MQRFRATAKGKRGGTTSRLGTRSSGAKTTLNSTTLSVNTYARVNKQDNNIFTISVTNWGQGKGFFPLWMEIEEHDDHLILRYEIRNEIHEAIHISRQP